MTYEAALAGLTGAKRLGAVPGLQTMARLLEKLGEPQKRLHFVHIAGTNGKGSTASYLAEIFQAAGWKTGLFTSPYIQDFRDRIRINGVCIEKQALADLAEQVLAAAEAAAEEGFQPATAFELVTALGLLHFARENCQVVVLEVGLGGRLDATNIIPAPEAAVLTRIGLDHTELLGGTLPEIAGEKAGIIKAGSPVIACSQAPEVMQVFQARAAALHCPFFAADPAQAGLACMTPAGLVFDWAGLSGLRTGMTGLHQLENAVTALMAARVLDGRGWHLGEAALRRGLERARCIGRLELLCREPLFLVDGAHNPQGARALAESLRALFPGRKLRLLVGMLADKAWQESIACLLPLAEAFYVIAPPSPRALPAEALAAALRGLCPAPVQAFAGTAAALEAMLQDCGPDQACCAFGSLYQIGGIRDFFAKREKR